ncbi:hypothetical protein PVM79_18340 [Bacillus licheniformis]|uniref:hypothetical protein n=1 Tax=Bacillus TaxID=1386 RepID=UPI000BA56B2E|nr:MULTISPECIES: hypothetical protein [Bacillus]MBA1163581.1 hypothetical protein [Bacillus licheniformis]MBS2762920.1 hypothetical protein [Bacillus licheniformis]MDE1449912.1 hypothetical protein [Bacillus licheniformis]MEC2289357.1 hypothetical protein [Bacillus licheniformis]PAK35388.1 hypothetical protein CHH87_19310 [Bacillus licheniformis]
MNQNVNRSPYDKVYDFLLNEGPIIVQEKFTNSLYHPSEQFQTSLYEVSDEKEKVTLAKVTVPNSQIIMISKKLSALRNEMACTI